MNAVKTLCDTAILLDNGRVIDSGEPRDVVDFYQNMILKKTHQGDVPVQIKKIEKEKNVNSSSSSTGEIQLISFKIYNENSDEISYIESEKIIKIVYEVRSMKDLDDPHYGLFIRNNLGLSVFETNTHCMKIKTGKLLKNNIAKVEFLMEFPLAAGTYSFSIGVANKGFASGSFDEYLLLIHDIDVIKVISNSQSIMYSGIFNMKPLLKIQYIG
jgi:lipopolysaccharide transport system ATP-binding protein